MRSFLFSGLLLAVTGSGLNGPAEGDASPVFSTQHGSIQAKPPARQSSSPVVILVHGRGHSARDSAEIHRWWKRDLDAALASAGYGGLRLEDVRLAWFADVLDPSSPSPCARPVSDSLPGDRFWRDFFVSLGAAIPGDQPARAFLGDILYALDYTKRCAAEQRVGAAIEAAARERRPVVVVAYSLGSLVSYGYLARGAGRGSLSEVRLVTLGSPIGNRAIRALLGAEDSLILPEGVAGWENLYDPDDPVAGAVRPHLRSGGALVKDIAMRASALADNPHSVSRYLRAPETGAAVARAFCAASPDERGCQLSAAR